MRLAAIILVFSIVPVMAGAPKDVWQACLDRGIDMTGCSDTELERLDPILAKSYRTALASATTNRDQLAAAQRAWEIYSMAACAYASSTQGTDSGNRNSLSNMTRQGCLVSKTRHRIDELSPNGIRELTQPNPASSAFTGCSKIATDPARLANCLEAEFAREDKNLNEVYRVNLVTATENDKSLGADSADERRNLIKAERRWIAFRDAQCGFLASLQQGPKARATDLRCRATMSQYRAQDLRNSE